MNLKPRPLSEAPQNQWLLARKIDDSPNPEYSVFRYRYVGPNTDVHDVVFWEIPDLLRAGEILDEITPVGMEYIDYYACQISHETAEAGRMVYFRRIAPPVEYRWEAEASRRQPHADDWIWIDGAWLEVTAERWPTYASGAFLCARRVEVKR